MKKKILIISNAVEDPSSYYRLIQYFEHNNNVKILNRFTKRQFRKYFSPSCNFAIKGIIACTVMIKAFVFVLWDMFVFKSDKLIINRKIFPHYCPLGTRKILKKYLSGRTVIWDFDDNIIYGKEIADEELQIYNDTVDEVVVISDYLKQTLTPKLQLHVTLLPTTDKSFEKYNLLIHNETKKRIFSSAINFIWVGTRVNLFHLEKIVGELEQIAKRNREKIFTLYVICNDSLKKNVEFLHIENIAWSRECVELYMEKAHIGLMPLEDNEFTRGKGAFKAIQYLGAGIPVVASPVGYNCNVIEENVNGFLPKENWIEDIEKMISDIDVWENFSLNARKTWERKFNSKYNQVFWDNQII